MASESAETAAAAHERIERVVLVGFMASGKSTVGPLVAERLGWGFEDLDAAIEAREGRSIPELFGDPGEEAFRRVEAEVASELLARDRLVLATGGGWAAAGGHMDSLPPHTLSVWLRVPAEMAVERVGRGAERPLLEVDDPVSVARSLLERRVSYYRRADLHLDTGDRTPASLADAIAERVRTINGPYSPGSA